MKVVIVGNGIMANLGALYLRRRLPPRVEIQLVGPASRGGMPVVGESTIEITARFLEHQLGLGPYLEAHHHPKYALTYYFKLDPTNPADRRYSVSCNERAPDDLEALSHGGRGGAAGGTRPPSWQLNRDVFDRDMRARVDDTEGIERLDGLVEEITIGATAGHTVRVESPDGGTLDLYADWVVDVSGRRGILAKQLGIRVRSEIQRDCFWFRVSDFRREALSELDALGPTPPGPGEPYHYDRYDSSHHFMGRGNWIWMIPLASPDHRELMSVGISMRPDVYPGTVRSIDQFLEQVGAVHPVVTDLVRSGEIVDTNLYRNYHYSSKRCYSEDRWAVIGDAAFAPDALFSNGLAFSTIQLEQLGEIIAADEANQHDPDRIRRLDEAFWAPVDASQDAIASWYETMHDPFLSSLRLNWIEIAYFYILLPLVRNRAHHDPEMMKAWRVLQFRASAGSSSAFDLPRDLVEARGLFDRVRPEHFIYRGKVKVNPRALEEVADAAGLWSQFVEGSRVRSEYLADAIAQVRIAESLSTDREPAFSL